MNDNASLAVNQPRANLGGLPQRLVQDGVVEESSMHAALQAASERKIVEAIAPQPTDAEGSGSTATSSLDKVTEKQG